MNSLVDTRPRKVRAFPADGSCVSSSVDVAAEFASQVRDRGKDTAGNDSALDFGEPQIDLVEPRGIGRGEVMHARMPLEEVPRTRPLAAAIQVQAENIGRFALKLRIVASPDVEV